jgi:RNA polymerase sigma-70 factor, ECF subfamily
MTTETDRTTQIESLHRKYAGVIFDLCVRILRDAAEAEDAVQETFINAFRSMNSFTYGDSYLPWLYRIGTNVCLKMLRTKKRKGALPMENIEMEHHATDQFADPGNRIDVRTQLLQLQESLDDRNMEIVVSHFVLGMNQQEVADAMGISRRAVVKRLTRLKGYVQELARITTPPQPMETKKNE